MYTVREFRENLREALNDAEIGKQVQVTRYGRTYVLQLAPGLHPTNPNPYVVTHINGTKTVNKDLSPLIDDPTYTEPEQTA